LKHLDIEMMPERILGMQKLEALFKQVGYIICQSSGERIYNFEEIVAIYIPLSTERDQVMAVHSDHAPAFIQSCLLTLRTTTGHEQGNL